MNNKEIANFYRQEREKNTRLRRENIEKIHQKFPEIAKLDKKIKNINIEVTLLAFSDNDDVLEKLDNLHKTRQTLVNQKKTLLIKNNINLKFDERIYTCKLCKDTGNIKENTKCRCYFQRLKSNFYSNSKIADIFVKQNFDKFNYNLYSDNPKERDPIMKNFKSPRDYMRAIVYTAKSLVDNINDPKTFSLYLFGVTGVGKTFLCSSIAKYALDNLKTAEYYSANRLFEVVANYKMKKDASDYEKSKEDYHNIINCDLLIIDDLGTEYTNDFVRSEFFTILNDRLMNNKKFVISSNISPEKISLAYGDRIDSRIIGNFELFKIVSKDLRKT